MEHKTLFITIGSLLAIISQIHARPSECGCKEFSGLEGLSFGGLGGCGGCGGYGGYGGYGEGCGHIAPSAPISFLPVPQPLPIRVPPPCPPQSVTIPNIIVALLPPNQRNNVIRRPIGPAPLVVPVPQPRPVLVPSPCESPCY